MDFEYDPEKSDENKGKHGINFEEAQELWNDLAAVVIPIRSWDEPRSMVVGKIGGRFWTGVITFRGEKTRLISVRRSRKEEKTIYESQNAGPVV
jgi:uncharacterized DUF497 family protein